MKAFFFVAALLSSAAAATAQTQPAAPAATEAAPIGVKRIRLTADEIVPEQQADQAAATLSGQLSLSSEQTAQVRAAALTWAQEGVALLRKHNATRDHSTLQQEDAAIQTKYENQLKAILTPAQYERRLMIQARYRRIREQAAAGQQAAPQPR